MLHGPDSCSTAPLPLAKENDMKHPRTISLCLLLALGSQMVHAGDVRLYRTDEIPDPQEVAAILGREAGVVRPIKWRSIGLLPARQAVAAVAPPPQTSGAADRAGPDALALPVQFDFDSARILPQATRQLDAMAAGIKLAAPGTRVVIEGHTDAIGATPYNERLSRRRAQAVKEYLIVHHGIAPATLRTVGMGPYRPFDPANPYARENRRVEFRADTSGA
jgi:outer membrane protein OmpA-like peptidoglycan-associated protein